MSSIKLSTLVRDSYKEYLREVVSDRALSDIYDGLKPGQRRLLWSAYKLGINSKHSHVKSARILGENMAKYHPHGENYGALVGMAQECSVFPLIDGQGGWGFLGDSSSAAAPRYTEARLSEAADKYLLQDDYLAVTKLVPNYDDTTVEPVRLPALLPLLLLMGTSGIAVGTRANIPAFTLESLLPVLKFALKRKVTWKDCVDLKINDILNAKYAGTKEEWYSYLKTGKGSLKMTARLKIEGKILRVLSLAQNIDSALDKLERQDCIKSVADMSTRGGINIVVKFKPQYKESDMLELARKIQKLLCNSINYSLATNVIRTRADVDIKTGSKIIYKQAATYVETTIPDIINMWIAWRVNLEQRMLRYRITLNEEKIRKLRLFVYAISKLDTIFLVLKTEKSDLDKKLAQALKITIEQAKQILDKTVRSLSNMSKESLLKEISKYQHYIIQDKKFLQQPRKKIYTWLSSL